MTLPGPYSRSPEYWHTLWEQSQATMHDIIERCSLVPCNMCGRYWGSEMMSNDLQVEQILCVECMREGERDEYSVG